MNLDLLRDYDEWLKLSPWEVLEAVKQVGGWKKVFPGELPRWAHRVRNYFNQEPRTLSLRAGGNLYSYVVNWDISRGWKENMALSGDVYLDQLSRVWFQMSPGATVYHFKHKLARDTMVAALTLRGQMGTPVFKLFSLDGSGGSCETIVRNPLTKSISLIVVQLPLIGQSTIGSGEDVIVMNRIVKESHYQGSYNYAETVAEGFEAHEKFDMKTHEQDENGYLNPADRFSSIHSRKFPKDDGKELLAKQKDYPRPHS